MYSHYYSFAITHCYPESEHIALAPIPGSLTSHTHTLIYIYYYYLITLLTLDMRTHARAHLYQLECSSSSTPQNNRLFFVSRYLRMIVVDNTTTRNCTDIVLDCNKEYHTLKDSFLGIFQENKTIQCQHLLSVVLQ